MHRRPRYILNTTIVWKSDISVTCRVYRYFNVSVFCVPLICVLKLWFLRARPTFVFSDYPPDIYGTRHEFHRFQFNILIWHERLSYLKWFFRPMMNRILSYFERYPEKSMDWLGISFSFSRTESQYAHGVEKSSNLICRWNSRKLEKTSPKLKNTALARNTVRNIENGPYGAACDRDT